MRDDEPAPQVAAVAVTFPEHRYPQEQILDEFARVLPEGDTSRQTLRRFGRNTGVRSRNLALPLERYRQLTDFTEANDSYLQVALSLTEQALTSALATAGIRADQVDLIMTTTVTGLAVPSLDARLAQRVGLRPDVKRVPLFGLGCVAGAAGIARLRDYLMAFPGQVAVLVAVELCSLTVQHHDTSMANLVATSLFGDGAAAVVAAGAQSVAAADAGPRVMATRSRLYPDSEHVMGWRIGSDGFQIVLSTDVAPIAAKYMGEDVRGFLAEYGFGIGQVGGWVCHPGGPKVIDTIEQVLGLGPQALEVTRDSLASHGNLSSVSVLHVLQQTIAGRPDLAGKPGLMIAMGPGFCSELVLLRW